MFVGVNPVSADIDSYYGTRSLNPMVKGDEATVYLPGGVELATENGETKYALADHLGSTRLAVVGDNSVSMRADYTPFGDNLTDTDAETTSQYTGMIYESETATHDYHARWYDGSFGRFGSVDAARASISPYSYTENDPVNHFDPTGLGRLSFWFLMSPEGKNDADLSSETAKSYLKIADAVKEQISLSSELSDRVVVANLENNQPVSYLATDNEGENTIHRLTISMLGDEVITRYANQASEPRYRNGKTAGRLFAKYVAKRLNSVYGREGINRVDQVESIFLQGNGLAEGSPYRLTDDYFRVPDSFAQAFADGFFPPFSSANTPRNVIASPYNLTVSIDKDKGITNFDINIPGNEKFKLRLGVNTKRYLIGDLPERIFRAPRHIFRAPRHTDIEILGVLELKGNNRYELTEYSDFHHSFFDKPVLYRIRPNMFTLPR